MKPPLWAVVVLFANSAWGQTMLPYQPLRDFLQLTDPQVNTILDANRQFAEWTMEKQRRIADLQREIAQQTAQAQLDPMALGTRYVEIETTCREIRDRGKEVQTANLNVLMDAQKAKLKQLEDAMKLFPTIAEAQNMHLLSAPASGMIMPAVTTVMNRFSRTDGVRLGDFSPALPPIAGCSPVPAVGFASGNRIAAPAR